MHDKPAPLDGSAVGAQIAQLCAHRGDAVTPHSAAPNGGSIARLQPDELIAATTTTTGLTVTADLDTSELPHRPDLHQKAGRRPADRLPRLPRGLELHHPVRTPRNTYSYPEADDTPTKT